MIVLIIPVEKLDIMIEARKRNRDEKTHGSLLKMAHDAKVIELENLKYQFPQFTLSDVDELEEIAKEKYNNENSIAPINQQIAFVQGAQTILNQIGDLLK